MKSLHPQKLIFIYNADSGFRNTIIDSAHKIISPSTYECNLCDITYGSFTENRTWKKFRKETTTQMDFLHRNEFKKQYASKFGYKFTYPIVLAVTKSDLEVFIGTKELNEVENAEELIQIINRKIKA